jgi:N utilization substance protein A
MSVDLVRIVDSIHREKNIPKEVLFTSIEQALSSAAKKHFPEAEEVNVEINPDTGQITTLTDGVRVEPPDFGRIAAQTAKQVIIQNIREAERDTLFDEFEVLKGEMVTGTVQRFEGGAVLVNLGKTDALLPRSEQIPGESHHPGERVRAVVLDVRKVGQRVKIILSRTHADFVRRLFELEIPEIADQVIQIRALAREAGYRSKVAVSSLDTKVDAVGACVGVRGTRIKNIVDELGGERIDIVRWNDSLQVLIPNALQPAEIEEVMLCQLLGRAIVLVREDQLSLAIGRRGQNVRLASKLGGWDIEIMTSDELDELIEKAVAQFCQIEGVEPELADRLVEQGILSFDDLSVMEIDTLVATIEGLDEALAETIVGKAEELAEQEEDTGPRRKGAKAHQPATEESMPSDDGAASLDDLLASPEGDASEATDEEGTEARETEAPDGAEAEASDGAEATTEEEEQEAEEDDHQNDAHDRALAEEASGRPEEGHEVTSPPDEEDLTESQRLFEEAEETGWTATAEAVADEDEQPSQAADPTGSTGPSE